MASGGFRPRHSLQILVGQHPPMEHAKNQNRVSSNLIEYRVRVVDEMAGRRTDAVQYAACERKSSERVERRREALAVEFRLFPSEALKPV